MTSRRSLRCSSSEAVLNGIQNTFVHDLIVHPREDTMVIATQGRGMYALDICPTQEFGKKKEEAAEAAEAADEEAEAKK